MKWLFLPLKLVVGLCGIFWMFLAGVAYVALLPAGWPNYDLGKAVFPVFHFTIHLPYAGEVQAQRLKLQAEDASLHQCEVNDTTLETAIGAQNASVVAARAEGEQMQARAQRAVQQAEDRVRGAEDRAAVIMSAEPAGADSCQQAENLIREEIR